LDFMRELLTVDASREETNFDSVRVLLERIREHSLYPHFLTIEGGINEPEFQAEGRTLLQFGANNYLSMSEHPAVKAAAIRAIEQFGVGPGGSRLMSGNVAIIEEAERRIAGLTGMEDCLTFPSGYMANVTVFQTVMNPFVGRLPYRTQDGAIFIDEYVHGSISDGCKMSGVRVIKFKHNSLDDLKAKLIECEGAFNKLIVTEGVYCLEGEIIDIPAYVEIARDHEAKLMVDDAHAIGVIGSRGGGSPDYHGCAEDIDILMGCMDKAMGGTGGFLCGSKTLVDFLRIAASSSVLSSALTCAMAGAMIAAIDLIEEAQDVREDLARKSKYLREGLQRQGLTVLGPDYIPSVPLLVGDEAAGVAFTQHLLARGIFCPVMRWPAVPLGKARLRLSLMARHEQRHLDALIEACGEVGRELGVAVA
ncbi:MAG TPA: aminotransferase class I/II-fold pyridoxal phosphate-dependent enzyme, partial [Thermoleophilia bacterium]|nr:aminotransferase class I/II-fold pyridoxal phosphate-dependent enzyme [Thermoleophilia bacterium]